MRWSDFQFWLKSDQRTPLVMGIVNVTPDSFSDGGLYAAADQAAARALQLVADGADLLDIGAESTRPGSLRTSDEEQIARLRPVLDRLKGKLDVVISIDTTRAGVARMALDSGAHIVNDISAGRDDTDLLRLIAERGAAMVLMHMQGEPRTMQSNPVYADVVAEIRVFLAGRLAAAEAAGVSAHRLLVDPGIGFGKTTEHNLAILRQLDALRGLLRPVMVGTSRKGFIGRLTGEADPSSRVMGTAATVAWALAHGADIVRVHDVADMVKVTRMIRALKA